MLDNIYTILITPLLGTIIGSAFVFFIKKEIPQQLQKAMLGFAAGVMVAASVWSLLIPAMDMSEDMGKMRVIPAVVGLLIGFLFMNMIDRITPHLHLASSQAEGLKSKLSRTSKIALAVTIHNLPEGMAVGIVLATALEGNNPDITMTAAMAVAIGMAIQNVPEGAIVAMPMLSEKNSRTKSFLLGAFSGLVEPIGAIITILIVSIVSPALPYLLAFSAGAMLYVVVEELIPEASQGEHSNISTGGFACGFTLMMMLDVMLS